MKPTLGSLNGEGQRSAVLINTLHTLAVLSIATLRIHIHSKSVWQEKCSVAFPDAPGTFLNNECPPISNPGIYYIPQRSQEVWQTYPVA